MTCTGVAAPHCVCGGAACGCKQRRRSGCRGSRHEVAACGGPSACGDSSLTDRRMPHYRPGIGGSYSLRVGPGGPGGLMHVPGLFHKPDMPCHSSPRGWPCERSTLMLWRVCGRKPDMGRSAADCCVSPGGTEAQKAY